MRDMYARDCRMNVALRILSNPNGEEIRTLDAYCDAKT